MSKLVTDYVLDRDEELGRGHFLRLRRVHLRNRYQDGTLSAPYFCELVDRPSHGTDAVVVGLWRRNHSTETVEVLLRQGLRPALRFGRESTRLAIPDPAPYLRIYEVVAGILEEEDRGLSGIKQRAVQEAWEEAGVRLQPADVELLGQRVFPSPGMVPEAFFLVCAEVTSEPEEAEGDGSPMEHGASLRWLPLSEALALCERGEVEDAKTEILLHRLHHRLTSPQVSASITDALR